MSFNPNLTQGQEISNDDIVGVFLCGNQGGMRRSHKTNSLILISDHTKGIYEDRWENNVLHYTGMGLIGNQSLVAQNKTLFESGSNGVAVFLFEVFDSKKYIFQGKVVLADKPYIEKQYDKDNNIRDVWIFPLKIIDNVKPALISEEQFKKKVEEREKQVSRLPLEILKQRLKTAPHKVGSRDVVSKQYDRNPELIEYIKRLANGICQLCGSLAPFNGKNGDPYLEIHHIEWLSKGGDDSIKNTTALCPNCHRKMHILNLKADKKHLLDKSSIMGADIL